MSGEVELREDHEPQEEPDHRFSVPAKKVMIALVVGLTVSLLATAFSYAYFAGKNRELQTVIDRRVPTSGISIELQGEGIDYVCRDTEKDGSFVCSRE